MTTTFKAKSCFYYEEKSGIRAMSFIVYDPEKGERLFETNDFNGDGHGDTWEKLIMSFAFEWKGDEDLKSKTPFCLPAGKLCGEYNAYFYIPSNLLNIIDVKDFSRKDDWATTHFKGYTIEMLVNDANIQIYPHNIKNKSGKPFNETFFVCGGYRKEYNEYGKAIQIAQSLFESKGLTPWDCERIYKIIDKGRKLEDAESQH